MSRWYRQILLSLEVQRNQDIREEFEFLYDRVICWRGLKYLVILGTITGFTIFAILASAVRFCLLVGPIVVLVIYFVFTFVEEMRIEKIKHFYYKVMPYWIKNEKRQYYEERMDLCCGIKPRSNIRCP
ncbi:MAG TPA: hypothetical protein PKM84_02095 [Candidatus Pacearchaeota archaeon]|nr:hypothetical protein [Candidatus Pacearchaeota archaeon]